MAGLKCHAIKKTKIVTIQEIKSRIWDMKDDQYIKNLKKIYVCAFFHSRVFRKSFSPNL